MKVQSFFSPTEKQKVLVIEKTQQSVPDQHQVVLTGKFEKKIK